MEEVKKIMLNITMESGRRYTFYTSTVVLDWLFDRMLGREPGNFQNIEDKGINISKIEYLDYEEL